MHESSPFLILTFDKPMSLTWCINLLLQILRIVFYFPVLSTFVILCFLSDLTIIYHYGFKYLNNGLKSVLN